MTKVFSKEKWLKKANEQIAQGYLSEREVEDALEIWVNDLDGKSKDEIGDDFLNDDWFVEV